MKNFVLQVAQTTVKAAIDRQTEPASSVFSFNQTHSFWERLLMGIFLTSVIGAALAASAPSAPLDDSQEHVAVSYGDLDLTTLAGRRSLDRRILAAAKKICSGDEYFDRSMVQQIGHCAGTIVGETQTAAATRVEQANARNSSILAAAAIIGK